MQKILIIDDDEGVCYSLARLLAGDARRVTAVQNPEAGFEALRGEDPDLVMLDVRIAGADGLEILKEIRKIRPLQLVVVMTAHGTTETAIEAMKRGAFDYVMKPFDTDNINEVVSRALDTSRLNRRVATGDDAPTLAGKGKAPSAPDRIIGNSKPMQNVYKMIGQVAPRDVPVLIRGESGCGKELVARALWQHSRRGQKHFRAVNCAALAETLLESELFGHERGAFTGAESRKLGKFEQADGGTLYLDEVGDMSIATQAKILRVLQDGTFQRVGGTDTLKVDVRIIAATHQDLEKLIRTGRFREDLYYRLRVVEITLPPLRERREDIPELVRYMVARHRDALSSGVQNLSEEAMNSLMAYDWPGNVRQMENVIRRAMVLCNGPTITADNIDFGPGTGVAHSSAPALTSGLAVARPSSGPLPAVADALNVPTQVSTSSSSSSGIVSTVGASAIPQGGQPPSVADLESLVERLLSSGRENLIEEMERLLIGRALEKMNGNQLRTAKLLGITRNTLRNRIEKFGLKQRVNVE